MPRIRLGREAEGRLRFLTEEEIPRLLGAAAESPNTYFLPVVTIALNTGMRKSEIFKLTWDRVDFSRGVLQVAETKKDRRRQVPMNRAVLSPDRLREAVAALEDFRSPLAHRSTQSGKIDPAPLASPRKAGVAQWQSN